MKKPALIPALIAVLLSACAAGPDYQRPPVDTPAAFKELGDWKPAEPREPLAADNWWAVFGDPVLDELQARLEVSNQNLRAAEAAYRQALAFLTKEDVAKKLFSELNLNLKGLQVGGSAGWSGRAGCPRRSRPSCR